MIKIENNPLLIDIRPDALSGCQKNEFPYEYDTTGLPVKVFRKPLKNSGVANVYDYQYINKSES